MKEVKRKEYVYTPRLKFKHTLWRNLLDNEDKIFNQKFYQHKISISDKIEYLKAVSTAEVEFWSEVTREYPELLGKNLTANLGRMTITLD